MQHPARGDLKEFFAGGNARQGLWMSGCAVAAYGFGMATPELVDLMHACFSQMSSYLPLADPVQIAGHYFQGAMHWFGSVAVGSAEMVLKFGGALATETTDTIQQVQSQIIGTTNNLRQSFDAAITRSAEVASLWRTVVRDSVAQPVIEGARCIMDMIPDSPAEAAKAFGDLMVTALEGFGVVKGMHEAYKWTMQRFRKKLVDAPVVAQSSRASGLTIGTVANLSINLSLGGDAASENALQQVQQILAMGGERKIQVDDVALRRLLDNAVPADAQAAQKQAEADADIAASRMDMPVVRIAAREGRRSREPGILRSRDILQVSQSLSLALRCEVAEHLKRPALSANSSIMTPITSIEGGLVRAMSLKPSYSVDRARITRFLPELEVRKSEVDTDRPNGPIM